MNWYKIKLAKYVNNISSICMLCKSNLKVKEIKLNTNHIYLIGQELKCDCGKSSLWTNSIRNSDELLKYITTGSGFLEGVYMSGFCNDKLCGFCYKPVIPLKNGITVPWTNQRQDLYGCKNCDNKNIVMDIWKEWKESKIEEENIIKYYSSKLDDLKKIIRQENQLFKINKQK